MLPQLCGALNLNLRGRLSRLLPLLRLWPDSLGRRLLRPVGPREGGLRGCGALELVLGLLLLHEGLQGRRLGAALLRQVRGGRPRPRQLCSAQGCKGLADAGGVRPLGLRSPYICSHVSRSLAGTVCTARSCRAGPCSMLQAWYVGKTPAQRNCGTRLQRAHSAQHAAACPGKPAAGVALTCMGMGVDSLPKVPLPLWPAFCRFSRDSMREEPERDSERLGLSSAGGEEGWLEPEATEAIGLFGAARPRRSGLNRESCTQGRLC